MRKITIAWYGYVFNGNSNVKGRVRYARNVHLKQSRRNIVCVSYMHHCTRWMCGGVYSIRIERNFKVSKKGYQRIIHTYKK